MHMWYPGDCIHDFLQNLEELSPGYSCQANGSMIDILITSRI